METVTLIGRLLVSLAAVLGLMWVIARRMKRPGRAGSSTLVDVLGRRQLSRTASVAVVRVLDQALIVGITDGHVSLIGETDLAAAERVADSATTRRPAARPSRRRELSTRIGPDGRILPAPQATAPQAPPRPAPARRSTLAGSALSPDTWRQTVESLRNLTARNN